MEITPVRREISAASSRSKKGDNVEAGKKKHVPTYRPMKRKIDMKAEADSEVHNIAIQPVNLKSPKAKKSSKSKKPVRSSPRKSVQKNEEELDLTVSDDELDELKHDDYVEESASDDYEDEDGEEEVDPQDLEGLDVLAPLSQHEPERNSEGDFEIPSGHKGVRARLLDSSDDDEDGYEPYVGAQTEPVAFTTHSAVSQTESEGDENGEIEDQTYMQANQEPSDEEMDEEEEEELEARNHDMDLLLGNRTYDQVE